MKIDKRLKYSLIYTIIFILILWFVKFYEYSLSISLVEYGVLPLKARGLLGIVLSPLIHGDFKHLISNSVPLIVLLTALFYFYKDNAWLIFFVIYFSVGILVWLIGRDAYHIGASGVVYGLVSFHFFTGIFSKRKEFVAISLIIVFMYGSLIWGIIPLTTDSNVSWEGHLMGFIIGIILALIYYRTIIIPPEEDEEELEHAFENFYDYYVNSTYDNISIKYEKEN